MDACMQRHQAMMSQMAQLSATVEQARRSNDPTRMREALDQTQQALREMRAHMQACNDMMNSMPMMRSPDAMSPMPSP